MLKTHACCVRVLNSMLGLFAGQGGEEYAKAD